MTPSGENGAITTAMVIRATRTAASRRAARSSLIGRDSNVRCGVGVPADGGREHLRLRPKSATYQRYRVMWPLVPAMAMVTSADAWQSASAAGGAIMFVAFRVVLAFVQLGRETATE